MIDNNLYAITVCLIQTHHKIKANLVKVLNNNFLTAVLTIAL